MLKIRLSRHGKKKQPIYRIVVAEHTMPIKGKFIEILGFYNPKSKEIGLKKEKIESWMKNGAKPSDTVAMLLRKENIKLSEEFQKPKKYVKAKKEKEKKETPEKPPAGGEVKTEEKPVSAEATTDESAEEKEGKKVPADNQPKKEEEKKQDKKEENKKQ
jgi:small subunit ribosomal protein S16